jgi:hypothetical protein
VTAPFLLQVPRAVAAQLTREILHHIVSAVIPDNVVGTVPEELDAPGLGELTGFLQHGVFAPRVSARHNGHFPFVGSEIKGVLNSTPQPELKAFN